MKSKLPIQYLNYGFALLFLAFIAWFKWQHHELWKDEWQAWFVAKDKSIGDMLSFLYYEGHPALWYVYLKVFSIFANGSNDLLLLNVAHLLTVAGGLYLLFIRLRLPLLVKVMVALSYFLLFEYGIVNRGYYLVIVFVFWAAYLLSKKEYNAQMLAVVLFLLCQTEVYGVLMAIALGFYLLHQQYTSGQKLLSKPIWGLILGLGVFVISVFPREWGHIGRTSPQTWTWSQKLLVAIQGNLTNTYMPGATLDTFTYGSTALGLILAVLILVAMYYIFRKDKALLLTMAMFLLAVIAFSALIFTGGIRQWGMGFVFFVAMLAVRGWVWDKDKVVAGIVAVFCVFNMVYAFKAVREDYRIPFTNAKAAGLFIKAKVPEKVPVVALNKFDATPVIGYSGRKFYELPDGVPFSFFRWVDKIYVPTEPELQLFGKFKGVGGIILLSSSPIDAGRFPSAVLWQKFDALNYKNESYFIYTLSVQ